MRNVQASWTERRDVGGERTRHLQVASRVGAPRPTWGRLYVALGVIAVAGMAAHVLAANAVLVHLVDAGFGLGLFVVLIGWVHANRVAIVRSGEPDGGVRPTVRIVRSRARRAEQTSADDGVVRLAPDERIVLPYDFR